MRAESQIILIFLPAITTFLVGKKKVSVIQVTCQLTKSSLTAALATLLKINADLQFTAI